MLRKKIINFVLVCLTAGPLMAQDSKLMSKDLREFSGNEVLMITVDHAPGASDAIHRHNAHAFVYVLEGSVVDAGERRKGSYAETRAGLL